VLVGVAAPPHWLVVHDQLPPQLGAPVRVPVMQRFAAPHHPQLASAVHAPQSE
jgi:hypothetical protein